MKGISVFIKEVPESCLSLSTMGSYSRKMVTDTKSGNTSTLDFLVSRNVKKKITFFLLSHPVYGVLLIGALKG